MEVINDNVLDFKLIEGYSAETSGGLLVMVPPEKAQQFQEDLEEEFGQKSWVIGDVVASPSSANPGEQRQVYFGENNDRSSI